MPQYYIPNRILSLSLFAGLAFSSGSCQIQDPVASRLPLEQKVQAVNPVESYALLISATSEVNTNYTTEKLDPIDVDCDSLTLFRSYKVLVENGFPDEHIFILYSGFGYRTPNFDVGNPEIAKRIKEKHFSGQYNNAAYESNIESILDGLKKRLDANDKFVCSISAHGDASGRIFLETDGVIMPYEFQGYLNGWKSNSNWFLIMNCYGGKTLQLSSVNNVCLMSATQPDKLAWVDRNWCSGERFLTHKADMANDTNKDGIVDENEAFREVGKDADAYWTGYLKWYLETKYTDEDLFILWKPDDISLQPMIKIGKHFKTVNLKKSP